MSKIWMGIGDQIAGQIAGSDAGADTGRFPAVFQHAIIAVAAVEEDLRPRAVWLTEKGAAALEAALPVYRRAHDALGGLIDVELAHRLASETKALLEG